MTATDVIILAEEEIKDMNSGAYILKCVLFVVAFFCILAAILMAVDIESVGAEEFGLAVAGIAALIIAVALKAPTITEYTIDVKDTAPFNDIYWEWDIEEFDGFSQDGEIYKAYRSDTQ